MSNNIDIKFTVDDAAAFRAWQRQQAQLAKLKTRLDEAKKAGETFGGQLRRAMGDAQKSIASTGKEVAGLVLGWMAVGRGVDAVRQSYDRLQAKTRDLGITFDEAFRKFNIQANLQGLQADQFQRKIETVAVKMAMDPIEVAGIAEQLVSSGYSKEEAVGASLEETVKLMVGTNQAMQSRGQGAVSTKDLVGAMSSFMDNMGMQKTGASVNEFAVAVQTAFKETNLQLEDMAFIAGEAAVFRGKMTPADIIAMGSILKDTNPNAAENSTAMRNITSRMAAVTGTPQKEMLAKMNIDPNDINMIGEDVYTALKKLRTGINALPEEERFKAAKILFEEKGMAPFMTFMQDGRIEEMQKRASKKKALQYEEDIQTGTSGKSAQVRRLKAAEDIRIAKEGQKSTSFDETLAAARAEFVGQGGSEVSADIRSGVAGILKFTNTYTPSFGLKNPQDSDVAAAAFTTFAGASGSNAMPEFSQAVQQRTEAAASPYGKLPAVKSAEDAVAAARQAAMGAQAGGITPEERTAVGDKIREATNAVRGAEGMSEETARQLMGTLFQLKQALDANSKATDQNTKTNGGGTVPTPATTANPPRPRNNQASRGLSRGSPLVGGMS